MSALSFKHLGEAMNFRTLIVTTALALSLPLAAQFVDQTEAPTENQISSVREAKLMKDEQMVWLEGYITGSAGTSNSEEYFFKDDSDMIKIEVDEEVWQGQKVTPQTKIRIWGEVDRNRRNNSVEIEVERLEIVK